jgi:hypothetical protein
MEPSRGRRSGEKSTAMRGAWRERAAAQLATPAHSSVGPATNAGGGIIAGITGTVTRPPHRARLEFATSGRGPIRAAAARGRGHPRSPPGRALGRRTAKGMAAPKARLRPKHGCAQSTAAPKARLRPRHGCAERRGAGPCLAECVPARTAVRVRATFQPLPARAALFSPSGTPLAKAEGRAAVLQRARGPVPSCLTFK